MGFMITSEASKQYLLEEDAVKGFEMAVANGQSRLALTILVDVIGGMMEVFHAMMDDSEDEILEVVEEPKVEPKTETVTEKVQEKKKPEPKKDQVAEKDDKKTLE